MRAAVDKAIRDVTMPIKGHDDGAGEWMAAWGKRSCLTLRMLIRTFCVISHPVRYHAVSCPLTLPSPYPRLILALPSPYAPVMLPCNVQAATRLSTALRCAGATPSRRASPCDPTSAATMSSRRLVIFGVGSWGGAICSLCASSPRRETPRPPCCRSCERSVSDSFGFASIRLPLCVPPMSREQNGTAMLHRCRASCVWGRSMRRACADGIGASHLDHHGAWVVIFYITTRYRHYHYVSH